MIKVSLVLVAAFCITWLSRKRPASQRHAVWAAAIIAAAALPALSLLLPSWHPSLAQRMAAVLPVPAHAANSSLARGAEILFSADGIETTWVSRIGSILWFTGTVAALLGFLTGVIRQRSLASRSSLLADPALTALTARLASEAGCRRPIQLRLSASHTMPMTWGLLRPRILLPSCVAEWSEERKQVVLAHEVAHIQRLDWLFQTVAQLACAVYWFNPLFWLACNRLYEESEHACDDAVIYRGVDARDYAAHLLEVARSLRQPGSAWSATLAMARESTLEKRFATLLQSKIDRRGISNRTVLFVTLATLSLVFPLAAMRMSGTVLLPAGTSVAVESAVPTVDQYTTPPLYSDDARARAIEGIVTVQVRVGIDGTVQKLQVVRGLGHGLDENALLAVRDWRFAPARQGGKAIEATTQIDVEFSLRNAELNEEIANDMATRIGPGVSPPQVVHRVEPQYAPLSSAKVPAGSVVLDAIILENGSPKIVRVIHSLDWEFDEIAINALKQWRFSPALKDGFPVKLRMNIAVNFQPHN